MKRESLEALGITVSGDLSVGELLRLSEEALMEPGISYKVAALRELCEEFCETATGPTTTVFSACDAVRLLIPNLKYLDHEECWVVLLDRANKILAKQRISLGTAGACPMDVVRIAKLAIVHGAGGVILSHNHPSGNTAPSGADIKETKRLRDALHPLGIDLTDHIIFADGRAYSFAEERELPIEGALKKEGREEGIDEGR